jgi:hypothetical protein
MGTYGNTMMRITFPSIAHYDIFRVEMENFLEKYNFQGLGGNNKIADEWDEENLSVELWSDGEKVCWNDDKQSPIQNFTDWFGEDCFRTSCEISGMETCEGRHYSTEFYHDYLCLDRAEDLLARQGIKEEIDSDTFYQCAADGDAQYESELSEMNFTFTPEEGWKDDGCKSLIMPEVIDAEIENILCEMGLID